MVQAGLSPTSVRDSITGAETEPSTNQGGGVPARAIRRRTAKRPAEPAR
jgi:hypothetical protein